MRLQNLALAVLTAVAMTSCTTPKTVLPYFTDIDTTIKESVPVATGDYLVKAQPGDDLFISVHSSNNASSGMFNLPATENTYTVDSKGDILIPNIGTLHVKGLTLEQIRDKVTDIVKEEVTDPIVSVRLINFFVNVAGEVTLPHSIPVTRSRYSILDAITDAGDLTPYGERNNVLLIREENGERTYHRLNLNSADLLQSPYFYLQQNDYIYVEPNNIREANAKYNQNNAFKLTVVSTVVSAASVIASLVIALTIRR